MAQKYDPNAPPAYNATTHPSHPEPQQHFFQSPPPAHMQLARADHYGATPPPLEQGKYGGPQPDYYAAPQQPPYQQGSYGPQQGMYGPPPGGYYAGQPPMGYAPQGQFVGQPRRQGGTSEGILGGCMAALACCCCLDFLF